MPILYKEVRFALCMASAVMLAGCANQGMQGDGLASPHYNGRANTVATARQEEPPAKKIPVANARYAKLTALSLNNTGTVEATIQPGKTAQVSLHYNLNCPECRSPSSQIIVGLAKRSAQACIYQGGPQGEGVANFVLKAPAKPGKYEIRFRILQAADCAEALKEGWNADNSPARETTIGTLIVSRKAPEEALAALSK